MLLPKYKAASEYFWHEKCLCSLNCNHLCPPTPQPNRKADDFLSAFYLGKVTILLRNLTFIACYFRVVVTKLLRLRLWVSLHLILGRWQTSPKDWDRPTILCNLNEVCSTLHMWIPALLLALRLHLCIEMFTPLGRQCVVYSLSCPFGHQFDRQHVSMGTFSGAEMCIKVWHIRIWLHA